MDIAALSVVMHQGQLRQAADILLMKKVMNQSAQTGEALKQLLAVNQKVMAQSVQPHLGGNVDITV